MMGHRGQMKGGDEYDALTRWKRVLHWRPGVRAWIKNKFNRRSRREIDSECCMGLTHEQCRRVSLRDCLYTQDQHSTV
jgi:hypothetical protein